MAHCMVYNPFTGERRDQRDIESDPLGQLIIPRTLPLAAATRYEFSLEGVFHAKVAMTGHFSKKEQGYIMGAFREAVAAHTPAPQGASTKQEPS